MQQGLKGKVRVMKGVAFNGSPTDSSLRLALWGDDVRPVRSKGSSILGVLGMKRRWSTGVDIKWRRLYLQKQS